MKEFSKEDEETLFEVTLKSIRKLEGYERVDQINYLIKILDEKPGILRRALNKYHWLENRNVFSDELSYPKDSEDYLEYNEWTIWNENGWEKIWKRFLVEVMVLYETWDKETQERFRIMDTKEKWGKIRIDLSGYNTELHELEIAAEMLSSVTCCCCGKQPKNSRGEHMIYTTKGYVLPFCKECFRKDWYGDEKPTKESKIHFKNYRNECRNAVKRFITSTYESGKEKTHYWTEKFDWLYKNN